MREYGGDVVIYVLYALKLNLAYEAIQFQIFFLLSS